MTWAPPKSRALIHLNDGNEFILSGQILEVVLKMVYLGVTISTRGIENDSLSKRIGNAKRRVHQLRNVGLLLRTLPRMSIRFYKSLVRPLFEYGLHLSKPSMQQIISARELEQWILPRVGAYRT